VNWGEIVVQQAESRGRVQGDWDDVGITPSVRVLDTRSAAPALPVAGSVWSRGTLPGASAALALLGSLGGVDAWSVNRITEDTWVGLAVQPTAQGADPRSAWSLSRGGPDGAGPPECPPPWRGPPPRCPASGRCATTCWPVRSRWRCRT
jgi:hypothetical protein